MSSMVVRLLNIEQKMLAWNIKKLQTENEKLSQNLIFFFYEPSELW